MSSKISLARRLHAETGAGSRLSQTAESTFFGESMTEMEAFVPDDDDEAWESDDGPYDEDLMLMQAETDRFESDFDDDEGWDDVEPIPDSLEGDPNWEQAYEMGVTYPDAVRAALGPQFETLTDEEVDTVIAEATRGMTEAELEGFWQSLGNFARKAVRVAAPVVQKLAPVVGGAVGTIVGGPAGTAIGSALGQAAGGLIGRAAGGSRARRPAPRRRARRRPRSRALPAGASSARAQLMRLIQDPALQQALLSAIMGGRGGGQAGESLVVPFGAYMNALSELAAEAALEVHESTQVTGDLPEYLKDDAGMLIVDPTDNAERTARLLEVLDQADALRAAEADQGWQ